MKRLAAQAKKGNINREDWTCQFITGVDTMDVFLATREYIGVNVGMDNNAIHLLKLRDNFNTPQLAIEYAARCLA